jgi:hypothetical protein
MHATSTLWVKEGERYKLSASESSAQTKIKSCLVAVRFNNIGASSLQMPTAQQQVAKL